MLEGELNRHRKPFCYTLVERILNPAMRQMSELGQRVRDGFLVSERLFVTTVGRGRLTV